MGLCDLLGLLLLTVVDGFVFCWWDVADRAVQPALVEPLDPRRVASSTCSAVRHGPRRPISSALYSPLTASASALSKLSPREPTEATAPSAASRWV